MSEEKKKRIQNILNETRKLTPKGREFIAGYIFGRNEEREERAEQRERTA